MMAFDSKGLDDYIDVAQRIAEFRAKHPEGSLQPFDPAAPFQVREFTGTDKTGKEISGTFIVYTAAAYRSPEDQRPGIGCAYEVFPGRTPYTAGSELQNAETAAWGRAIVAALAADTRAGIASKQEMRNRQAERDSAQPVAGGEDNPFHAEPVSEPNGQQQPAKADGKPHAGKVLRQLHILFTNVGIGDRQEKLGACAAILGRPLESSRDMTDEEIDRVYTKVRQLGSRDEVVAFCAEQARSREAGGGGEAASPSPENGGEAP
jgi:hypothetical protein